MAKASPTFSNFTAGELSPKLDGRTELSKYFNGAKQLQNFLVVPQGGATRRPGTEFIAETKASANAARLIPFEFNVTQAYVCLLYTSPSPRDGLLSRMPSSA